MSDSFYIYSTTPTTTVITAIPVTTLNHTNIPRLSGENKAEKNNYV